MQKEKKNCKKKKLSNEIAAGNQLTEARKGKYLRNTGNMIKDTFYGK